LPCAFISLKDNNLLALGSVVERERFHLVKYSNADIVEAVNWLR